MSKVRYCVFLKRKLRSLKFKEATWQAGQDFDVVFCDEIEIYRNGSLRCKDNLNNRERYFNADTWLYIETLNVEDGENNG